MPIMRIPHDPRFDKNFRGEIKGTDVGPCVICGSPVKAPGKYFVHMMEGGWSICTPDEDANVDEPSDLGLQPIGSQCVRAHPELKPYIRKRTEKGILP